MPRAMKHCGINGCTVLVKPGTRCDEHSNGWKTSPRTASSKVTGTRHWQQVITPRVLARFNYQCQLKYDGICQGTATTVDKIIPAAKRPDLAYNPHNHQAVCQPCNQHKNRTQDR
ncbi:hypothetical protein [Mycobacterium syngnathidarum]|uniref:HNH endonuclease n=1 Tax=Mycobacterium syngnathidarum TaxID=1908205 RepID=A0A1Q9WF06_9MYCO|nr:hypothetical protein [Mycobacterium syngnathidarum]OHT93180.1 hypothetical protein BKG61_22460 [Mycobacterium syngnathidarum]OLT97398.1 hypothetical protein BKG60_07250 [Mycobacterium syngnathidarum]